MGNHLLGGQRENLSYDFADFFLAYFCCSLGVHQYRDRLGYSNDVSELEFAGVGQTGCDDIFGDVSSHIACGPVNFSGVFAAEAAAAVAASSAISVNDDFSAGNAAVSFRAAYDESACLIDMKNDVLINKPFRQNRQDNFFDDLFPQLPVGYVRCVLGSYDDCVNASGFAVFVFNRYLAFAIRPQPG